MTVRNDEHMARGPLVKRTYRFYAADIEWLRERYPDNYSAVIRKIINHWVHAKREQNDAKNE